MSIPRLAEAALGRAAARPPAYDRGAVRTGVVHLGLGAFARAHLCVYLDDMLALGHPDLGLYGVSLRHDDVPRALRPQDGLYTLAVIDNGATEHRVIGSVRDVVHAPSDPAGVRAALSASTTTVVSVTVTEKGYCWDPASRRLDPEHPDVRHDVESPESPRSLPGNVVLAALDRRAQGGGGVTVLSLDNLPSNGHTLEAVTLDLAEVIDPSVVPWIEDHVRFPCSMVDRLVPATDDAFRAAVSTAIGVEDAWPVRAERFSQWVVERDWFGATPPLGDVGVTLVDDVAPWETMKLRVLNALHTSAAHFGLFHGLVTVDRVVADPDGRALLVRVAAEVAEVLVPPDGVATIDYVASTLDRFANSGLGHRCAQIATDTSQKLPQRLLDTVRARLSRDLPVDALADVLALWAWSTLGRDHTGAPRQVQDPLAPTFAEVAERYGRDPAALAAALLSLGPIFGDLAGHAALTALVATRLSHLMTR